MILRIDIEVDDELMEGFTPDDEEGIINQLYDNWDDVRIETVDMEFFEEQSYKEE